jgi:hypothetical protein
MRKWLVPPKSDTVQRFTGGDTMEKAENDIGIDEVQVGLFHQEKQFAQRHLLAPIRCEGTLCKRKPASDWPFPPPGGHHTPFATIPSMRDS